jgi:hypothetical protein
MDASVSFGDWFVGEISSILASLLGFLTSLDQPTPVEIEAVCHISDN